MPLIRSISPRHSTSGSLANYIFRDIDSEINSPAYLHNILGVEPDNLESIIATFEKNNDYRKQRRNSVAHYHEVISFSKKDKEAIQKNPALLMNFAKKYLELRAPNSLAVAKPHFDRDNLHLHIMISGNQVRSSEPSRVTSKGFFHIKKIIHEYQKEHFPELEDSLIESHEGYYVDDQKKKLGPEKEEEVSPEIEEKLPQPELLESEELEQDLDDQVAELILEPSPEKTEEPGGSNFLLRFQKSEGIEDPLLEELGYLEQDLRDKTGSDSTTSPADEDAGDGIERPYYIPSPYQDYLGEDLDD